MSNPTVDKLEAHLTACCEQILGRERDRLDAERMTAAEREAKLEKLRAHLTSWRNAAIPAALRNAPNAQGRI